jgi:hypothetical protein
MDPVTNPYQPGAGRRPPEIAGRDRQIAAFATGLERCELGYGERGVVLSGLRGVGKTVLLNEFASIAERRRWITAKVEASAGRSVLGLLTASLYRSLRATARREGARRVMDLLRVFKAFSLTVDPTGHYTFGVDVEPAVGRADSGDPDVDLIELLEDLGATTRDLGAGTLLLIDEMQDVPAGELATLNSAVHAMGQAAEPLPVQVVGAGLPSLPEILSAATSYAERLYVYVELGRLTTSDAHAALVKPAKDLGVGWEPEALAVVDAFAEGYPYFLQTAGKYAWDYAPASPITADDAEEGLVQARREVDAGLYRVRWQRATAAQRLLMAAVAELGGDAPVLMADVAQQLGKARTQLSVPRDQLIKKGLLYAPERGYVGFTVPGMADYVLRRSAG